MSGSVIDLSIAITAMDAASGVIRNIASNFGPVGMALVAAGAAAIGFGVASVKAAANFQESMTQLVTGAGESQANLKMVADGILALAVSTGTSTKQLTDGMYMIESAGFHGAAGLAVLKAAAEGAKVGNADLGEVANAVTSALNAYGLSGDHAAMVTNTLIATVAAGKMHMSDLSYAISSVLAPAKLAGLNLQEVGAALSTMTMQGTHAANGATYLKQMLIALDSPGKAAISTFQEIGLNASNIAMEMRKQPDGFISALEQINMALAQKFPLSARYAAQQMDMVKNHQETMDQALANMSTNTSPAYMAAVKNISGGSKNMMAMMELTGMQAQNLRANFNSITASVNAGGNAITGWSLVQQNFNFKIAQAREVVETLMIKIGTALLPVLSQLMDSVTPLLTQFSTWITTSGVLQSGISSVTSSLSGAGGIMNTVKGYVLALFEAVGRIVGAFGHWMISGGGLKAMLDIVRTVIANIYPPVSHLITVVSQAIAGFITWGDKSGVFNGTIQTVGATLGFVSGAVGAIIGKIADFIGWLNAGSGPANVLKVALLGVGAAIAVIKIGGLISSLIQMIPYLILSAGWIYAQAVAWLIDAAAEMVANWPIYLIIAAIMLLIGIIVLLVTHWNQIIAFLRGAWQSFASWFMSALRATGQFFVNVWTTMVSFVTGIVSGVVSWLKSTWANAVSTVVGWFSWLYNHNYYFKDLVDFIRNVITTVVSWLRTTWSTVTGWIAAKWAWLREMATIYFMALYVTIQARIRQAENFIHTIWSAIVSWLQGIWSTITGDVSSAWGKISSIFSSAWNTYVAPPLNTLKNSLLGFFTNLASLAVTWGKNLISGFINGIKSMFGAIGGAVQGIMSHVAGFMGFHSPAKEGPGRELDVWGPNLMKGYAQGILSQLPMLQHTLNLVMSPVSRTLSTIPAGSSTATPTGLASSGGSAQGGGVTVVIQSISINDFGPNMPQTVINQLTNEISKQLAKNMRGQRGGIVIGNG